MKKKRVGIKLGSAILTNGGGEVNEEFIRDVCRQVAELMDLGHDVFIVTSGAVASDRNRNRSKNLRSAVGQPLLMQPYIFGFRSFGIDSAQILLTDEQFHEGRTELTKRVILEAFRERVVPVINANDVVDGEEIRALLKCADNDMMFNLVCQLLRADVGIIGFANSGVEIEGKTLPVVSEGNLELVLKHSRGGNASGHGENGMKTKVLMLVEMAKRGTRSVLASGKEKDFILRAFSGEEGFGTQFRF